MIVFMLIAKPRNPLVMFRIILCMACLQLSFAPHALAEVVDRPGGRLQTILEAMVNKAQEIEGKAAGYGPRKQKNDDTLKALQGEIEKLDPNASDYPAKKLELDLIRQKVQHDSMEMDANIRRKLQSYIANISDFLFDIKEEVATYKTDAPGDTTEREQAQHMMKKLAAGAAKIVQEILGSDRDAMCGQALLNLRSLHAKKMDFNDYIDEFSDTLQGLHKDLAAYNQQLKVDQVVLADLTKANELSQKMNMLTGVLNTVSGVTATITGTLKKSNFDQYKSDFSTQAHQFSSTIHRDSPAEVNAELDRIINEYN